MPDEKPIIIIQRLMQDRMDWTDDALLAELESVPTLPDEFIAPRTLNPLWYNPEIQAQQNLFLALSALIAQRKLKNGVPLLLARACYGDVGEMMRGLFRQLRRPYAPDFEALAEVYIQAAHFPQKGARLWAISDLGTLLSIRKIANRNVLPTLFHTLRDSAELVQIQAANGLEWCAEIPEYRSTIIAALEEMLQKEHEGLEPIRELLLNIQRQEST